MVFTKGIFLLCAIILVAIAGVFFYNQSSALHFGPPFVQASKIEIAKALSSPGEVADKVIQVEGKITRQCPSAGCWFFIEDASGKSLRVELGHMGMKFPQRVGKVARVQGKLLKEGENQELIGNSVEFQ